LRCLFRTDSFHFAGTNSGVFRSSDDGASWTFANLGGMITGFAGNDDTVLVAKQGGVFRSTDSGAHWDTAGSGITSIYLNGLFPGEGKLFAFTLNAGVFLSTDNGRTWIPSNTGLTNTSVLCMQGRGTDLFVGSSNGGVFRSTDGGVSWNPANTGLTDKRICALAVYGSDIFAATDHGVWRSSSQDETWVDVSEGLPTIVIYCLTVAGDALAAGTFGGGVWTRPLSEIITSAEELAPCHPGQISLEQNYPNPFNPSTTIRYGLPSRSQVMLTVFNALGQQLATLVQGEQAAGYHEAVFDASGLASGVYLYRLQVRPLDSAVGRDSRSGAGDHIQTQRMLVVR